MSGRASLLPASLPPIGLGRTEAAAYLGIGTSLFDQLVATGAMPQPRALGGRMIWDVEEIARAFRAIPHRQSDDVEPATELGNPWEGK